MRRILLSDTDRGLWNDEMLPSDYEFLSKHKDTFRRMWIEQGKVFWERFLKVFTSYILKYSLLRELPCEILHLENTLDFAFKVINDNYVQGKPNQAKHLLYQIADLGRNRHKFQFLDSRSLRKDPFYTPETRDLFRDFFGKANERTSYFRVYLLTPVYMRFGGSVVRCLVRWKEAEDIDPSDDTYYMEPVPLETHSTSDNIDFTSCLCVYHKHDCGFKFYQQLVKGDPAFPVNLTFWGNEDPRFFLPGNPLWNPSAMPGSDWREELTPEKFTEFYAWCSFNEMLVKPENQCPDCRARRKTKKKNKKKKKKKTSQNTVTGLDKNGVLGEGGTSSDRIVKSSLEPENENCIYKHFADSSFASCYEGSSKVADFSFAKEMSTRPSPTKAASKKVNNPSDISKLVGTDQIKKYFSTQSTEYAEQGIQTEHSFSHSTQTDRKVEQVCEKRHIICKEDSHSSCVDCRHGASCSSCLSGVTASGQLVQTLKPSSYSGKGILGSKKEKTAIGSTAIVLLSNEQRVNLLRSRMPTFSDKIMSEKKVEKIHIPGATPHDPEMIARFEVTRKQEADAQEVKVYLTEVETPNKTEVNMGAAEEEHLKSIVRVPSRIHPILTSEYLTQTVDDFPPDCLCAEDIYWCAVEVDYSAVEKDNPSHFILMVKIEKPEVDLAKELLILLLGQVVRRKRRPSAGWVLTEDDILMFCLTLKQTIQQIVGMTFTVCTGGPLHTRLSNRESTSATTKPSVPTLGKEDMKEEIRFIENALQDLILMKDNGAEQLLTQQKQRFLARESGKITEDQSVHAWAGFESTHISGDCPDPVDMSTETKAHQGTLDVELNPDVQAPVEEARFNGESIVSQNFSIIPSKSKKRRKKNRGKGDNSQSSSPAETRESTEAAPGVCTSVHSDTDIPLSAYRFITDMVEAKVSSLAITRNKISSGVDVCMHGEGAAYTQPVKNICAPVGGDGNATDAAFATKDNVQCDKEIIVDTIIRAADGTDTSAPNKCEATVDATFTKPGVPCMEESFPLSFNDSVSLVGSQILSEYVKKDNAASLDMTSVRSTSDSVILLDVQRQTENVKKDDATSLNRSTSELTGHATVSLTVDSAIKATVIENAVQITATSEPAITAAMPCTLEDVSFASERTGVITDDQPTTGAVIIDQLATIVSVDQLATIVSVGNPQRAVNTSFAENKILSEIGSLTVAALPEKISPLSGIEGKTVYEDLKHILRKIPGVSKENVLMQSNNTAIHPSLKDKCTKTSGERQLSICSNCGDEEPALRTYKKCQRCKVEGVANARYYCSKKCQQDHWLTTHFLEHSLNKLNKNC